eukprot:11663599-Karenia_brevis.AAC.1
MTSWLPGAKINDSLKNVPKSLSTPENQPGYQFTGKPIGIQDYRLSDNPSPMGQEAKGHHAWACLLYTSDAADDM